VLSYQIKFFYTTVADPHHLDADPDLAFHSHEDPDPTFHSDEDPDPIFHSEEDSDPVPYQSDANLRPLVYRSSSAPF
jgi:hypothetical protein